MTLKEKVYHHFFQLINDKISLLENKLKELKDIGSNETKSTAGDKHETALAMIQIEQENTRKQLKDALEQKALFEKIDPLKTAASIHKGSLIKTNHGYLFLSIALGKAKLEDMIVTALSPQSPLGIKLIGLQKNDFAEINNIRYQIESVE
jgi:hypothetical protein